MSIICACLPTFHPLISRLREISEEGSLHSTHADVTQKQIALEKLKSKVALSQNMAGESRAGFTRLSRDIESGSSISVPAEPGRARITTHMGTSLSGFEGQSTEPETILRQQIVEQYRHP